MKSQPERGVVKTRASSQWWAPLLMGVGSCSMYLGAAFGTTLFRSIDPLSVAWLRICGSAIVFAIVARPHIGLWRGSALLRASAFGITTALMNMFFYLAISILPLGTAVAIEFLGPTAVAALLARSARGWLAAALALVGVVLVSNTRLSAGADGVVFALLAALCWAGYVILGKRVSTDRSLGSLSVGFCVAAFVTSPVLLWHVGTWGGRGGIWDILFFGLGLGVLSNVVPYSADQFILRRVGEAYFSVLLAILPLAAVLIGFVVLHQKPAPIEWAGVLCVAAAVALCRPE